jgi:cation diffusion facilitator CzcD-associated flavoprotein CzcO
MKYRGIQMSDRPARSNDCEVIVIGAGPYGLSVAAHLKEHNVATRVFGDPMSFWRRHMPKGMRLRSPWNATHIADPHGALSLDAYLSQHGLQRREPISLDSFIDYGLWFQGCAVPDIDRRMVERVESAGDGFRVVTADGDAVHADRVVIATGLAHQQFRPAALADVPAALASHTCDHDDLGVFRGQRVAVVGRGQSACESAVLLHEAGADVEIICRGDIHWLGGSAQPGRAAIRWLSKRLASPSGVGPFPLNWLAEMPGGVSLMPDEARAWFVARCLRPGVAGWLRPRFDGVRVLAGERIHGAVVTGERIALMLDHGTAVFDHVLLGTGYRVDIAKLGILGPDLLRKIACRDGAPRLAAGFETNVPGLHFVGASAVASYGPLMRFIVGATFAARELTQSVLENRSHAASPHERAIARNAPRAMQPMPRS